MLNCNRCRISVQKARTYPNHCHVSIALSISKKLGTKFTRTNLFSFSGLTLGSLEIVHEGVEFIGELLFVYQRPRRCSNRRRVRNLEMECIDYNVKARNLRTDLKHCKNRVFNDFAVQVVTRFDLKLVKNAVSKMHILNQFFLVVVVILIV